MVKKYVEIAVSEIDNSLMQAAAMLEVLFMIMSGVIMSKWGLWAAP